MRVGRLHVGTLASVLIIASAAGAQSSGTKPTVVSTDPANGAVNVNRTIPSLSVTFSKPMAPLAGMTTSNWYAGGPGSSYAWSTDQRTLTYFRESPPVPLATGTKVTVMLNPAGSPPTLRDTEGNYLDPYTFSFTIGTTTGPTTELIKVAADVEKGFSWPYYLFVPASVKQPPVLMVEPNNTGTINDDPAVHDSAAQALITNRQFWASDLGVPYLVPTFPRPATNWLVYTQSLDRDTLQTALPGLVRIDLQLIAMIDDARARLEAKGIRVDPKVWMIGYSASASFTSRFTVLHPDRVKAASFGSGGSYPIAPVSTWKGKILRYPVGVADLEQLVGQKFNQAVFRTVPLHCYTGDQDLDDALNYADGYDAQDSALIKEVFGGPPPFMRWPASEAAYKSIGSNCQFVVFPGMRHQWLDWKLLKEFFERNRTEPFPPPLPKPLNYTLYFPHVGSIAPWETEIALTNTSEVPVRGELHAYTADGGNPIHVSPISIAANGRLEITAGNFFPDPKKVAYLSITSDSGFLAGYTRFYQPGNRVSLPMVTGAAQGWFTKVEKDGWTGIAFVNVEETTAQVSLAAFDDNGTQLAVRNMTLQPGRKYVSMVFELFPSVDVKTLRFFRFTSDKKLVGFTVSGSADGFMLDGLHSLNGYIRQR